MKGISGKEFSLILMKKGWELKRIKGSPHIFAKPGNPARISIPIHSNRPLKVGLLKHLMNLAEILVDEL